MLKHLAAVVALLATTAALSSCGGPAAGAIRVSLESPTRVVVTGFSRDELASLAATRRESGAWAPVLRVSVQGQPDAIAGRYSTGDGVLAFTPAFALELGRHYDAIVDLTGTSVQRTPLVTRVDLSLPADDRAPTTRVLAVEPAAEAWPANTLRAYVYFSAPMDGSSGVSHITLRDDRGQIVEHAFLTVEAEFWTADRTRYTVFFDPGRVKQGIRPNRELGRPLRAGVVYRIEIDPAWKDAAGRPLVEGFQRTLHATSAIERPLALADWQVSAPAARSTSPLTVTFPWGMDRPLLERALTVVDAGGASIPGSAALDATGKLWTFTPASPWSGGTYQLKALPVLEDPSGNQIGKAFEVDMNAPQPVIAPTAYTRAFVIR